MSSSSQFARRPSAYKNAIAEYTETLERLRSSRRSSEYESPSGRRAPSLSSLDTVGLSSRYAFSSPSSYSSRVPQPTTSSVSRARAVFDEPVSSYTRTSTRDSDISRDGSSSSSWSKRRSVLDSGLDRASDSLHAHASSSTPKYSSSSTSSSAATRTFSRQESLDRAREIIAETQRAKEKDETEAVRRRSTRGSSVATDSGVEAYQSHRTSLYNRPSSSTFLSSSYGRLNGSVASPSRTTSNGTRESSPVRAADRSIATETQRENGVEHENESAVEMRRGLARPPPTYLYRRSPEKTSVSSSSNRHPFYSRRDSQSGVQDETNKVDVEETRFRAPRHSSIHPASVTQRRPTASLEGSTGTAGLVGLKNIGNTCFMNSGIQCLSNSKPLRDYCLGGEYEAELNSASTHREGPLITAFANVMDALWKKTSSYSSMHAYDPDRFHRKIQQYAPRFSGYLQQDAQEFLRYLLEGLHEDINRVATKPRPETEDIPSHLTDAQKSAEAWKRYLKRDNSKIVELFVGQLKSSLVCDRCQNVSVTFDPFWDIALPIPAARGHTSAVDINDCLRFFTKKEVLDDDERPTCERCRSRQRCTKSFTIQRFPRLLVIHLKRFAQDRSRGKMSNLVDYPVDGLDLSPFAAESYSGPRPRYNLYAVSCHTGSTHCGHYTAYCKHPASGTWSEYNDSRVSPASLADVVTSSAYVLFYELVD